jgi:hypothetical protein
MNSIVDFIDQNPGQTKRLIGINRRELNQLVEQARSIHEQEHASTRRAPHRFIARGNGSTIELSIREQIILTLVYLSQFPTVQLLDLRFGMSETIDANTIDYWLSVLQELLPLSLRAQVEKTKMNLSAAAIY